MSLLIPARSSLLGRVDFTFSPSLGWYVTDVRLVNDSRVEKDESHPGKICERHWFERNKHIFPASRWEIYDPNVDLGDYSLHGSEVRGKRVDENIVRSGGVMSTY